MYDTKFTMNPSLQQYKIEIVVGTGSNRPFDGFFQLLTWTSWGKSIDTTEKSAFKISKIVKFESDLLKSNEDIASQSHKILQKFVWWGACPTTILQYKRL